MCCSLLPHSAPLEYFFVIVSVFATFGTGWAYATAAADLRLRDLEKRSSLTEPMRIISGDKQREAGLRFAGTTIVLLASLASLFVPPPPPDYINMPQSMILICAFILAQFLTMFSAWLTFRANGALLKYVEEEACKAHAQMRRMADTVPPSNEAQAIHHHIDEVGAIGEKTLEEVREVKNAVEHGLQAGPNDRKPGKD